MKNKGLRRRARRLFAQALTHGRTAYPMIELRSRSGRESVCILGAGSLSTYSVDLRPIGPKQNVIIPAHNDVLRDGQWYFGE